MFDGVPGGDDLFLYSLGYLLDSRVQNLDDLCVWCHVRSRGQGGRVLSHPM